MDTILIRYGEIALKGKNRISFTRQLRRNIRAALKQAGINGTVYEVGRRIYVETDQPETAGRQLQRVFGIVSFSPVLRLKREIETLQRAALQAAERFGLTAQHSFRVETRRSDKSFPLTSPEIDRLVGGAVQEATGARVDLRGEVDLQIGIEIQHDQAVMFGETIAGPGGLPLPISGRVVVLMSGGIDSPVAAWMMMKRGCGIIPLHFSQSEIETSKALDNCRILAGWSFGWRIEPVIIPHEQTMAPVMHRLQELGAERWACILCKRTMLLKAAQVAEEAGAQAIVLGDSLGQVASQTLSNIEAISYNIPKPILRPLIGLDKTEITAIARRIGTFDISTRAAEACPYLPANPITRAKIESLREILMQLESNTHCESQP